MMKLLYSLSIRCLISGIKIASLFNNKAKQAIEGRKNWRKIISDALKNNSDKIIWFHVSSLGEFEQARPLIIKIKTQFPEYKILLTFFSPSGYNARKNFEYADWVFYMPYDTSGNARDFLDIVKPHSIIFVKYEFWLNFLNEIKRRKSNNDKINCFLVSSIFRKHQPFFKWYGKIFVEALTAYDKIFVQDNLSIRLLKKIGIENNVILSGDTRVDRVIEISQQNYISKEIENFCNGQTTIICGSTWYPDEQILVPVFSKYISSHSIKIIIAPHQPDEKNVSKLIKLLENNKITYCRFTHLSNSNIDEYKNSNVLIIDTVGVLNKIYRYGYLAYIGGGFTDGIHNILEPAVYGLPVIFGPKYEKFYEAVELIKSKGAFTIKNISEFDNVLGKLLNDKQLYNSSQKAVNTFIKEHQGAVEKTISELKRYF